MDPYEYLFQKLGIKSLYNAIYHTQIIYTDSILPIGPLPGSWNPAKIFSNLRNTDEMWELWYDIDVVKLTKLLRLFPEELESKEHVDLLLTLQGINKGA